MLQQLLQRLSVMVLLFYGVYGEGNEINLKAAYADITFEIEEQEITLAVDFHDNLDLLSPIEQLLYGAAIADFMSSYRELIIQALMDNEPTDGLSTELQAQVQVQLQAVVNQHIENYVQQKRFAFYWMMHIGFLCALLYTHSCQ